MKVSLRWIEEILKRKIDMPVETLAEKLLHLGFEVSQITPHPKLEGIVAAQILKISKHPNADRLQIAEVTDGKETKTVVCGAPNIQVKQKVFWAKVGAKLKDGMVIKETPIRGFSSPGMLCSAKELGIGEDHSGILSLPEETSLGITAEKILPLEDTILELEITPNRPDCLSHLGIAREILLLLDAAPLKSPEPSTINSLKNIAVAIENQKECSRYIARLLEGVKIGLSPLKTQTRLIRCGIRPINNAVDITNYVLLETGHPLHAFDADKLEGRQIIVRKAKEGEKILALDGKSYPLDSKTLVIADAKKPVAIAGIMGGEETAVTSETKNILLESAVFNKSFIRSARTKLNLTSESSYRFERGVSYLTCELASEQASGLISSVCGGKLCAYQDENFQPKTQSIAVRFAQTEKILGEKIDADEIKTIFKKIGANTVEANSEKIVLESPGWRLDLNLEADFIEEILRLRGYAKSPSKGDAVRIHPIYDSSQRFARKARNFFESAGFFESCNYGLVSIENCKFFAEPDSLIQIGNPLSQDQCLLRPSLIPELIKNVKLNLSYQKKEIRFFEIGTVFQNSSNGPAEKKLLAGIACGKTHAPNWQVEEPRSIDIFWIKGAIENFLKRSQVDFIFSPSEFHFLHPACALEIKIKKENSYETIGWAGELHPKLEKNLGLSEKIYIFELDFGLLKTLRYRDWKTQEVPRTPAIQRDCSIWIKEEIGWANVLEEINAAGAEAFENCDLFDVYTDPKQKELKSLSFTLTFRDPEKTLNDETANALRDKIVGHLHKKFNASLREK